MFYNIYKYGTSCCTHGINNVVCSSYLNLNNNNKKTPLERPADAEKHHCLLPGLPSLSALPMPLQCILLAVRTPPRSNPALSLTQALPRTGNTHPLGSFLHLLQGCSKGSLSAQVSLSSHLHTVAQPSPPAPDLPYLFP